MTPSKRAVLRAIKASMAHWRRVWEGKDESIASWDCALCFVFARNYACPLRVYGVSCGCGTGPYAAVANFIGYAGTDEAADMWMVLAFICEAEASDG